jgi:hypothetical protein
MIKPRLRRPSCPLTSVHHVPQVGRAQAGRAGHADFKLARNSMGSRASHLV